MRFAPCKPCITRNEKVRTVFRGRTWAFAVRHPLGDLLIPFVFGLAVQEPNDDHGHVITTNATGFRVGSQAIVHHVLANLFEWLLSGDTSANELNNILG